MEAFFFEGNVVWLEAPRNEISVSHEIQNLYLGPGFIPPMDGFQPIISSQLGFHLELVKFVIITF